MRQAFPEEVERARKRTGDLASRTGDDYGFFFFKRKGIRFKVMASSGTDEIPWEHVSVSTEIRCPTWEEMAWVKGLFFDDEEAVIQFHPPASQYVNYHRNCLHLWKPHGAEFPLPPMVAVGPAPHKGEGKGEP